MTVPVNTVTSRAAKVLNDDGMVAWTQAELVDWLKEGQLATVELHPDANTKTVNHALVAGAKQTNPADCIQIVDMPRNVSGGVITPCDRGALDRFLPDWRTTPTERV